MTSDLTPFEREAIAALLAGDHPLLIELRRQADQCQVSKREFDGVGFFTTLSLAAAVEPIRLNRRRIVLNDIGMTWDGLLHGAGLIVFIDDGRLAMLEGFTYAGELWPEQPENWRVFPVEVHRGGGAETNLEQLDGAWPGHDSGGIATT